MTRAPGPIAVISPHLDDAVLACGTLIAANPGAAVVTVFAGRPPGGSALTEWDRASGFTAGDDVIGLRREEDRRALDLLGAGPHWLDFLDAQYAPAPPVTDIAAALDAALDVLRPGTVVVPFGLFHSDHASTHAACVTLLPRRGDLVWFAYEEPMYRTLSELVGSRLEALRDAGLKPTAARLTRGPACAAKRAGVACYASQLRALATPGRPGHADAFAEERYWKLAP